MALTQVSRGLLSTSIVDNGNATAITIDSSENVGIGTSVLTSNSIVRELAVKSTATNGVSRYTLTTADNGLGASISLSSYLDENALIFGLQTSYDEDGADSPTERMRIDSSGNVGIGCIPNATLEVASGFGNSDAGTNSPTIRITNDTQSSDWDPDDVIGTLEFQLDDASGNAPYDAAFIKTVNDVTNGSLASGALTFGTATYNTVGGAVERMRIDSSGHLMLGVSSISDINAGYKSINVSNNQIMGAPAGPDWYLNLNSYYTSSNNYKFKQNGYAVGMYHAGDGNLVFRRSSVSGTAGNAISWNETMRTDASGNLLVGTTATNIYSATSGGGVMLDPNGPTTIARSGNTVLYLNRTSTDGKIIEFRKNGTTVGSISTNGNSLPSDRNFKTNIKDLSLGLNFISSLEPVTYNYKIDDDGAPVMAGLIAQDVETALAAAGVEANSMTLLQHNPTEDEKESDYQMDYIKLVPVLINAVKELTERLEQLENN